ncbi:MAG: hypothetical protein FRX49_02866 [Trebouxia sp. A1-2]|nr:MAG: hypothetical protein FRX49_02866 [Trebouxia sp. A1-2]
MLSAALQDCLLQSCRGSCDERDDVGQAILTRPRHLNAALDVALCTTGACVGDKANHEKHDYHSSAWSTQERKPCLSSRPDIWVSIGAGPLPSGGPEGPASSSSFTFFDSSSRRNRLPSFSAISSSCTRKERHLFEMSLRSVVLLLLSSQWLGKLQQRDQPCGVQHTTSSQLTKRNCNNPLYSSKRASPPAAVIASAPLATPCGTGPLDMAPLLVGAVTPLAAAAVAGPLATLRTAAGWAAPLGTTAVVEGSRRALAGVFGCKQAESSWKVIGWMAKTLVN